MDGFLFKALVYYLKQSGLDHLQFIDEKEFTYINEIDVIRTITNISKYCILSNSTFSYASLLFAQHSESGHYDFVGFVEGGDIPRDKADVIVTDGFTGNIALKTGEGTASLIGYLLKQAFRYSPLSRLAQLLAVSSLRRLQKRIDPRQVNGGVFLGLNGTVVKSHGSADALGVSAAVKLAVQLTQSKFSQKIAARLASITPIKHDETSAEPGTK